MPQFSSNFIAASERIIIIIYCTKEKRKSQKLRYCTGYTVGRRMNTIRPIGQKTFRSLSSQVGRTESRYNTTGHVSPSLYVIPTRHRSSSPFHTHRPELRRAHSIGHKLVKSCKYKTNTETDTENRLNYLFFFFFYMYMMFGSDFLSFADRYTSHY